ncbi:MAG: hypothetical protein ACXU8N_10405 [Telluria sp.]
MRLIALLHLLLLAVPPALALDQAGIRPPPDKSICVRAMSSAPAWSPASADEAAMRDGFGATPTRQTIGVLSLAPKEALWWLRSEGGIDFLSLGTALHEAIHTIDIQLSACHSGLASYLFDGRVYVTDVARGSTPPSTMVESTLPEVFKRRPLGRDKRYFNQASGPSSNDFTILLDEFGAYVSAAQFEVNYASKAEYQEWRERKKLAALDSNIGGTVDFMLYTLCYLKALSADRPGDYRALAAHPALTAHLQRLWTAAEQVLAAARPYLVQSGGLLVADDEALRTIYGPNFSRELDRLGIRHATLAELHMKL